MDINMIISIIREECAGAWWCLFHTAGANYKFLPTGHLLSPDEYAAVRAAFPTEAADTPEAPAPAPKAPLTPEERKKNMVRAKADAADD
jgi:hypothetical protein|tara:strand:- start:206 stop:472 length:267 start_codon:yes stop_codon:yes gene_type:complete